MSLLKFTIKRALHGVVVAWAAVTIIFFLRFLSPRDPISALIPADAPPHARENLIRDLALDQPIYVQYLTYLWNLLQGDLGFSYSSRVPVIDLIAQRLPLTIELAVVATMITIAVAIPLGVISARNRHEPADYAASLFALVGISTPNFWLGIMLILLVSVQFGVLPTSGREIGFLTAFGSLFFDGEFDALITWLKYITLPAVTLGTYYVALVTRLTRGEMLEQLGGHYVTVLEAKGLPQRLITYKHVLRNSLLPVVTVLGLQFGSLLGGTVVIEVVFSWPGLGEFLVRAINLNDWPVIQGTLVVIAMMWVAVNFTVDVLYTYIDPRVTLE